LRQPKNKRFTRPQETYCKHTQFLRNGQKKARELSERAEDLVEHGKEVVTQKKEQIATAVDAGREAYQRARSKAQGA
jgi:hypothetical protein